MTGKRWYRYYMLVAGSTILTLGVILSFRTVLSHKPYPGLLLGGALIVYGFMRLRQRSRLVAKK